MKDFIAILFGLGLVANAGLFVVQAVKIYKAKSSEGLSTMTFAGFSLLQIIGILHGYFQKDYYLLTGMAVSLLACGTVTVLSVVYRKK